MKRVVRSLLLFFCTTLFMLSATVCVFVMRVHADDTPTYFVVAQTRSEGIIGGIDTTSLYHLEGNAEVRGIIEIEAPWSKRLYLVTKQSGQVIQYMYNNSGNGSSLTLTSGIYYYSYSGNTSTYEGVVNALLDNNYPSINVSSFNTQTAIDYTWGDHAIDPVEPVSWGLVDLEGYHTNIAGQGNSAINNVDVISWNDTFDTNSNDISNGNVRVRYVPGYYRATSKQNLLAQTYQDFVLDIISAVNGDVYPVSDGSASFRWGDVIGSLSIPFYSIYNLTNSTEGWLKRGWIYEVRLEIDDYIGEWQTVYASTSSGVENDMAIVNTTVVTQETITAIQNINSINGTTNIWIINGQPVDPNPEVTPPASDDEKPWWVYLLEMINNTLGIQNEYINEGTDESIEIVNNFEEDHDNLNVTVNDYDNIENNIVNDMNDNLEDLDIESDLIENNSFLSSARWVAEQYTRITTNNPIGSILKFSLVLGFVMIFLGRFK